MVINDAGRGKTREFVRGRCMKFRMIVVSWMQVSI